MEKLVIITSPSPERVSIKGIAGLDLAELIVLYGAVEAALQERSQRGEFNSLTKENPQEQIVPRLAVS